MRCRKLEPDALRSKTPASMAVAEMRSWHFFRKNYLPELGVDRRLHLSSAKGPGKATPQPVPNSNYVRLPRDGVWGFMVEMWLGFVVERGDKRCRWFSRAFGV